MNVSMFKIFSESSFFPVSESDEEKHPSKFFATVAGVEVKKPDLVVAA